MTRPVRQAPPPRDRGCAHGRGAAKTPGQLTAQPQLRRGRPLQPPELCFEPPCPHIEDCIALHCCAMRYLYL